MPPRPAKTSPDWTSTSSQNPNVKPKPTAPTARVNPRIEPDPGVYDLDEPAPIALTVDDTLDDSPRRSPVPITPIRRRRGIAERKLFQAEESEASACRRVKRLHHQGRRGWKRRSRGSARHLFPIAASRQWGRSRRHRSASGPCCSPRFRLCRRPTCRSRRLWYSPSSARRFRSSRASCATKFRWARRTPGREPSPGHCGASSGSTCRRGATRPGPCPCVLITGAGSTLLAGMDLADGADVAETPPLRKRPDSP